MCHLITLIIPSLDQGRLKGILKAQGRVAVPVHNPSLAAKLDTGETQFLTTRNCDCGTVFAPSEEAAEQDDVAEIARLRKRGWSEAKIERSLASRNHAQAMGRKPGVDSLAMWADVLHALLSDPKVERVGLFLHFYAGAVEAEALRPGLRLARKGEAIEEALRTFREDEILIFRRSAA